MFYIPFLYIHRATGAHSLRFSFKMMKLKQTEKTEQGRGGKGRKDNKGKGKELKSRGRKSSQRAGRDDRTADNPADGSGDHTYNVIV